MKDEYAAEWIRFADMDLAAAEHLQSMYPVPMEIVCYHCQQAAEKYLKGFLIASGVADIPRVHDLDKLQTMCSEYNKNFDDMSRACNFLTRFGVSTRYPAEMDIDEHAMKNAIEYASQIKDFNAISELRHEDN